MSTKDLFNSMLIRFGWSYIVLSDWLSSHVRWHHVKSTTKQSKQNTVLCLFCVSLNGLRYQDSTVNERDCMYIRTAKAATVKPLVSDHSKFQDRWLVRRGTVYLSVRGLKIRYKINIILTTLTCIKMPEKLSLTC